MTGTENRLPTILRGVAEPLLAMVSAIALTILLTLPFVPTRTHLQFTLRPVAGVEPTPHEELEAEVRDLGLADEVRVYLAQGASRLELMGVDEDEAVEGTLADLLERSGYQPGEPVRDEVPDPEALLSPGNERLAVVMAIQALVYLVAALFLARTRIGRNVLPQRVSQSRAVLYGVGAGVVAVLFSIVLGAMLELIGLPAEEQAWLTAWFEDPAMLLSISPWVVLAAPVAEELFFRFYMFRFIVEKAGLPTGLVVSSLFFSVNHFHSPGLLIYLGIGCVLAWVYHRTGRIVAPIVGHATLNAIVLISTAMTIQLGN